MFLFIVGCYGLNCVPPKFPRWSPNSQCDVFRGRAFGRWFGLHEVMRVGPPDGTSALTRRDTRELALCLPYEDTVCKPGRESSPGNECAGTLTLRFPAPRTVGNKFVFFKPPSMVFCYGSLSRPRQWAWVFYYFFCWWYFCLFHTFSFEII